MATKKQISDRVDRTDKLVQGQPLANLHDKLNILIELLLDIRKLLEEK